MWLPDLCVRLGTMLAIPPLLATVVTPVVTTSQHAPPPVTAPRDTVRLAVAGEIPLDARRGLIMSVEESARVAGLLGRAIALDTGTAGLGRAAFVITAAEPALAGTTRGIVLDVGCTAPPTHAAARWFGLCPAGAPAGESLPGAAPSRAPAGTDSVVGWDAALEKYGASQLNDRYHARWGAPMTEAAWRGWLAAKIAWEASLRGPRDPAALARWLTSPAARFDGHQGVPLSFDARHRLRHPHYRVLHRGSTRTIEALP